MSKTTINSNSIPNDLAGYMNCGYMDKAGHNTDLYDELAQKDRDLSLAAELGQMLLETNDNLRRENSILLEQIQQKIFEMEREKLALKKQLENAEADAEVQITALATDVRNIRRELSEERRQRQQQSSDIDMLSLERDNLAQDNVKMKQEVAGVRQKMEERLGEERLAMQEHLQQLDSLHVQIVSLRKDKRHLELEINRVMQERDDLVHQLEQSQSDNEKLENINIKHLDKIERQQEELTNLERAANHIQCRIEGTSSSSDATDCNKEDGGGGVSAWWELWMDGAQEVEIDDDSSVMLMTQQGSYDGGNTMTASDADMMMLCGDKVLLDDDEESNTGYVIELKSEVMQVYCQLRQICAELTPLSLGASNGNSTPTQLVRVELEFKLGGLRTTLGELSGLLGEMTHCGDLRRRLVDQNSRVTSLNHQLDLCRTQLHDLDPEDFKSEVEVD